MAQKDHSLNDFGLLIAYLLPGFSFLWGVSPLIPSLETWLTFPPEVAPTVGGFLHVTIAAVFAGLVLSTLRWAVLDFFHHRTGIRAPRWDFSRMPSQIEPFSMLVRSHYRYYQFYGNSLMSFLGILIARRVALGFTPRSFSWEDAGILLLSVLFYFGSRDALAKYYDRAGHFLSSPLSLPRGKTTPEHVNASRSRKPRRRA